MAHDHFPIHILIYGDFGAGKSSFAATCPGPLLAWCFDAYGKDTPYLRNPAHAVGPLTEWQFGHFRHVMSRKTGAIVRRLEYYHDTEWTEPELVRRKAGTSVKDMKPSAYARFLHRMSGFDAEAHEWQTVVLDSVTSMEICARRWDQFILNPQAEDARQWYGASKDMLERMLLGRLAALPMNVVVLAHVDDEKYESNGTQRRMPMAPGKLRGSLPSQYGEVYRAFADASGHWLQTRSDAVWACTTQIDAPALCPPVYAALWSEYEAAVAPQAP